VRVCRPEVLWVLKIIAGRNQDLADLFAVVSEPTDFAEVREVLSKVRNDALQHRIDDESARLDSDRIFAESLSARFSATSSGAARRSWTEFKRRFREVTSD
jgi:hypothetical protein